MNQIFGENRFLTLQDTNLKISRKLVGKVVRLTALAFRNRLLILDIQTHSYCDSRFMKLGILQGFLFVLLTVHLSTSI
jgi:hypothetical protein